MTPVAMLVTTNKLWPRSRTVLRKTNESTWLPVHFIWLRRHCLNGTMANFALILAEI